MSQFRQIVGTPTDLEYLLKELDLSDETLGQATLSQGHLYMEASKFYVRCLEATSLLKAQLKERRAFLGQHYRKLDRQKQKAAGTKPATEAHIQELIDLSPSVKKLVRQSIVVETKTEWASKLLEAFKMRRDSIKILSGVLEDESRAELRTIREERAKRQMKDVQSQLSNKYPGGEAE